MAEWKKVVVSGSAISQLENDSNYLSSAGDGIVSASNFSSPTQGEFTASINGVETEIDLGLQTTDDVQFASITGSLKGNVDGDLTGTASYVDADNVDFAGGTGQSLTEVSTSFDSRIGELETGTYDLDIAGDSGTDTIENSDTLTFTGGEGIDTSVASGEVTIAMANNFVIAGSGSIGTSLTVAGDLTVNGTTTTVNSTNLNIEDKFILLSSGSTSGNDAGLVIDGQGASFGWDESQNRWAFDFSGATFDQATITSDAYAAAVVTSDDANYRKNGNIRIESDEVYIYVE